MQTGNPPTDFPLIESHVRDLTDADHLAAFFGSLGYPVEGRMEQKPENLGIEAQGTLGPIRHMERLAAGEVIQVFLVEVKSVTVSHVRALARAFRNLLGEFLLVLTSDYERLDFIYLERYQPEGANLTLPGHTVRQARIHLRTLSVDRRNPSVVAMRVLRRLTWTEPDEYAQLDKIVSAYNVAEWADPNFNNRALFSDHFLNTRFRRQAIWKEDPRPAFRELQDLYRGARGRYPKLPTAAFREHLLEPVLGALGFQALGPRAAGSSAAALPEDDAGPSGSDLLGESGERLARFFPWPWNRHLDARDVNDLEHPEAVPGVMVVKELERSGLPWLVLTNGKLWRLYSREAHSRATNYFEVDLEEVLAGGVEGHPDPDQAFRYFWLLFRRSAFEPRPTRREGKEVEESLLDSLLADSRDYARELEKRLKDRVFDQVFPTLATGFLRSRLSEEGGGQPSQSELDTAYRGTLTFLYRVLFLLYAEARHLLPVHETRGYAQISLRAMLKEVAAAAGEADLTAEENLRRRYPTDSFQLYDRLWSLFQVIDRGSKAVNVPLYNGGLFLSDPAEEDRGQAARAARFLARHRVPDGDLAVALDRLARDEDPKKHTLVPIDYRSLGVRHLGSIYEGLLEFRLRRAEEELAVVKGKRTEEVMPLTKARRQKAKPIVTDGRGKGGEERRILIGELYLENDRKERKATGSYYTPDFVVEYMVKKTVGPLVDEKLEALRPRLREAQRWRRLHRREAPRKGEDPAKYDYGPAVEKRWAGLIDDFFDVKVLDPSMGSGHFLVEVVDYLADRFLEFLAGFPWNPVYAHTEQLRVTIRDEMERQEINIDPERLTDVNLLKRQVLKRCIYGVDVNPMAVELAKVSLWLDCFTLGAPLSFLDHHLRPGNSLLGVSVERVQNALEGKDTQALLFGSRFTGLTLAANQMARVGAMADITGDQIGESRQAYRGASDALARYVRMLDVYTSRWFSNRPKKSSKLTEPVLQALQHRSAEAYFQAETEEEAEEALAGLDGGPREVIEAARRDAARERFFHWELEFPEVFYRTRPGTAGVVERRPEFGFDAVVGNPPWVRQESIKELKEALAGILPEAFHKEADLYTHFFSRGLRVMTSEGRMGLIVPNKWFKSDYGKPLRTLLNTRAVPREVIDFGHSPLFEDADTFPAIILLEKPPLDAPEEPEPEGDVRFFAVAREDLPGLDLKAYGEQRSSPVPRSRLRPEGWELMSKPMGDLMEKIRERSVPLHKFLGQSLYRGLLTGFNEAFLIDQATRDHLIAEDPSCEELINPYLRGADVRRWRPEWANLWMLKLASSHNHSWPWSDQQGKEAEDTFRKTFPSLYDRLKPMKERLARRQDRGVHWWELRSCDYYGELQGPKILYKDLSYKCSFSLDEEGLLAINTCYFIPSDNQYLLSYLNSSLSWWLLNQSVVLGKSDSPRLHTTYVETLPIVEASEQYVAHVSQAAEQVGKSTQEAQQAAATFKTYLEELTGAKKLPKALKSFWARDEEAVLAAAKQISVAPLSRPQEIELLKEFREARRKMRALRREICRLEIDLHHRVFDLYDLTPEEVQLVRDTAPPRDPLALAEAELAELETDETLS